MSGKFEQWVQDTYGTDIKGYELSKHVRLRDVTRWANQYAEGIEANLSIDNDGGIAKLEAKIHAMTLLLEAADLLLDRSGKQTDAAIEAAESLIDQVKEKDGRIAELQESLAASYAIS